ncbi:unnamed protein product [Ceutorhynchus assimilis]|uniref:CID domain-containing protein n=1 Tax=Ceutorhynchus assimilis TaxID=467358 RepID=A0A9N9MAP1_9CUCU|nr:unnamed protein product [Ceutorhynchus assimilis]
MNLAKDARRITLMYLANDVLQNSRKITRKYTSEFRRDIERVFKSMSKSDETTRDEMRELADLRAGERARGRAATQSRFEELATIETDNTPVRPLTPPESREVIQVMQEFESKIMSPISPFVQNVTEELAFLTERVPDRSTIALIQNRDEAENLIYEVHGVISTLLQKETLCSF